MIEKDNIKPFKSYRKPCYLHLFLAETIWCLSNWEVKHLQCYQTFPIAYLVTLTGYFLAGLLLQCVLLGEISLGRRHRRVVSKGRSCIKKMWFKASLLQGWTRSCLEKLGRNWKDLTPLKCKRNLWAVWELCAAQTLLVSGHCLKAGEGSIAGAPLANPIAWC